MTKHFHHKPVFGGDLAADMLTTDASVSGLTTVKVRNNPHDSHFHVDNPGQVATYVGAHGTLVMDHNGNWTYTLDAGNAAVIALASAATLTDAIAVKSEYRYRAIHGTTITITITGA